MAKLNFILMKMTIGLFLAFSSCRRNVSYFLSKGNNLLFPEYSLFSPDSMLFCLFFALGDCSDIFCIGRNGMVRDMGRGLDVGKGWSMGWAIGCDMDCDKG